MFDRVNIEGDEHLHVNVRQLPHDTADAARLYGEMVAKAEREVANATVERLGAANEAAVVRVVSERNMETGQAQTRVLFTVNGQLYDVRDSQNLIGGDTLRRAIASAVAALVYQKLCRG